MYYTAVDFIDTVQIALRDAEAQAISMGHTVAHSEHDVYDVKWYAIQCALQNLNNPRRKGETWNSRIDRLLREENIAAREWKDIVEGLPMYAPKEFLGMPYVEDVTLCDCIQSYRNRGSSSNEG